MPGRTETLTRVSESTAGSAASRFDCRLCGYVVQTRPWGAGECGHCGSTSMPVLPAAAEINAFYAKYNEHYSGGGSSEGRNLERYAQRFLQIVKRWRKPGSEGARLIDVGSSNNPFPNVTARAGFDTTMVDFARPAGLDASVRFVEGSLNDEGVLAAGRAAFDVVTSWAVMEHVPDPPRAARVLAGLCKPGGLLIMSTPEGGTLLTRHAIGHSPWFYPPEHLCVISPAAFEMMFAPLGLRMLHWGRLELSWPRFVARYGIGVAGLTIGAPLRALAPVWWQAQRDARKQRFQGVTYFVFEKALSH